MGIGAATEKDTLTLGKMSSAADIEVYLDFT